MIIIAGCKPLKGSQLQQQPRIAKSQPRQRKPCVKETDVQGTAKAKHRIQQWQPASGSQAITAICKLPAETKEAI